MQPSDLCKEALLTRSVLHSAAGCQQSASWFSISPAFFLSRQMWACALGHLEAAQLLYHWNSRALSIPDSLGRLPLTVARSRGHVKLATCLEELQRQEEGPSEQQGLEPPADGPGGSVKAGPGPRRPAESLRIPSPLSASPDTGRGPG